MGRLLILCLVVGLWLPGAARADRLLEVQLAEPPHGPGDAPDVIVHVPTHFDGQKPAQLLVFLHGYSSCTRALMASTPVACTQDGALQQPYGLAALHEQAGTNTLLVVPQLAFLERKAGSPRFAKESGFALFVRELRHRLCARHDDLCGVRGGAPASVTLLAHSAGYRAAAQALRSAGDSVQVENLVLFDALYADWDIFARWLAQAPEHRLVSLYTRDLQTREGNRRLQTLLKRDPDRAVLGRALLSAVDTPHRRVPERYLLPVLRALFVTRALRDAVFEAQRPNASARQPTRTSTGRAKRTSIPAQ